MDGLSAGFAVGCIPLERVASVLIRDLYPILLIIVHIEGIGVFVPHLLVGAVAVGLVVGQAAAADPYRIFPLDFKVVGIGHGSSIRP